MSSFLDLAKSLVFLFVIYLDRLFPSDRIRGNVYATGRPSHDHFFFIAHSESFASGIQLENELKLIF